MRPTQAHVSDPDRQKAAACTDADPVASLWRGEPIAATRSRRGSGVAPAARQDYSLAFRDSRYWDNFPMPPLCFISYRRQDSSAAARWIASTTRQIFGPNSVFIDTETIRIGDCWQEKIGSALNTATVLAPIIGSSWLQLHDNYGRRRIDLPSDWVRLEIEHAISHNVPVIPLVIGGATAPPEEALPDSIRNLLHYQYFEIRDRFWEQDIKQFHTRLEDFGFRRLSAPVRFPKPRVRVKDLSIDEVNEKFEAMSGWSVEESPLPGKEPLTRLEIKRSFYFKLFEDAITFMVDASKCKRRCQAIWLAWA